MSGATAFVFGIRRYDEGELLTLLGIAMSRLRHPLHLRGLRMLLCILHRNKASIPRVTTDLEGLGTAFACHEKSPPLRHLVVADRRSMGLRSCRSYTILP